MTWVLFVILSGATASSPAPVPGFPTRPDCQAAALMFSRGWDYANTPGVIVQTMCLPMAAVSTDPAYQTRR